VYPVIRCWDWLQVQIDKTARLLFNSTVQMLAKDFQATRGLEGHRIIFVKRKENPKQKSRPWLVKCMPGFEPRTILVDSCPLCPTAH